MNKNNLVIASTFNYLMQPGDGTMYRFGFANFPKIDAYTMEAGVGPDGTGYIWYYINMASSTGVSTIMTASLRRFLKETEYHVVEYAKSHGMEKVYDYTLVAILLALGVLVDREDEVDRAAEEMLRAGEIVGNWNAEMEVEDENEDS